MKKQISEKEDPAKMKKSFSSRLIQILIYIVLIAVFLFSAYHVFDYILEGKRQSDLNQSLIDDAITDFVSEPPLTEEELAPSTQIDSSEIKDTIHLLPDISVDLSKIKAEYPNVVGWLYLPNTVLHYPIMQADNNQYYVNKLPNGATNANGSLFLDCRNQKAISDWNHIIYGHNMINRSMFGILMDYRSPSFFAEHPYMFYFTECEVFRLEIFAGVHTTANSLYYHFPANDAEKERFLSSAISSSAFSSDVSVSVSDRVMVLSTCSGRVNEDKRFIVIAKLVPLL